MAAVKVIVVNNSGHTVGLTLDDVKDAERIAYLKTLVKREDLESVKVQSADQPKAEKPLEKRTVDELRQYAADKQIDLGDATKKDEILASIAAAEAPQS